MKNSLLAFLGKCAGYLILAVIVIGCADRPIGYPLESDAAYPFDQSYQRFFKGHAESEQALILVGSFGDEVLTELRQSAGVVDDQWIIHLSQRRYNDVYLIPIIVGKEFNPDNAIVAPNAKRSNGVRGEMVLRFRNSKTIRIDKPGIYYFGNIIFNDGKANVVYKVDQHVIDLAVKKYPKIFADKMQRVNF